MLNNLSLESLQRQVEAITTGAFLSDPLALLDDALDLLTPPEDISTVECAEKYRLLPGKEGGAIARYDRWRTPYNLGPMEALDDPACNLLVIVKPSRSGGTAVCENYLFKRMLLGPMTHCTWVLNSDGAVADYCREEIKPMFDMNPDLQGRVGKSRGDDTDTFKRVAGYPVEWRSAKDGTFRNREPGFFVLDESDAYAKRWAASPKTQIEGRQKQLGNRRKAAILSHPDLGWNSGVGACFEGTSRGIYIMRCPHAGCRAYAAACATKFWEDIPEFKLSWSRNDQLRNDDRLKLARQTAALTCPHCGAEINDRQRMAMIDEASTGPGKGYLHRGQRLDPAEGIMGEPDPTTERGFWQHGTILKTQTMAKLAEDYEAALMKRERTGDATELKEFLTKQLCEIYEGAATIGGVSPRSLKARAEESGYERGQVPKGVQFITAAVDCGGRYFDVMWIGWDLSGRGWLLDRVTIRQRRHADGIWRDVSLPHNIDDWMILLDEVVDRRFELDWRPGWALPVAAVSIDTGDGNVTWKAREFARRALRRGHHWQGWSKVKLIKGQAGKRPILPDAPRKVDRDELGRAVEPVISEYTLGVDRLKELTIERLAIVPSEKTPFPPGLVHFPREIEGKYLDEFFGETLVDGKWKRNGRNESLDLYGYAEAARLLLKPDDTSRNWTDEGKRPPWARFINLSPAGPAPKGGAEAKSSLFKRFDGAVNQNPSEDQ